VQSSRLSNRHHQQTNIRLFYRSGALPVAKPTVSEHYNILAKRHSQPVTYRWGVKKYIWDCAVLTGRSWHRTEAARVRGTTSWRRIRSASHSGGRPSGRTRSHTAWPLHRRWPVCSPAWCLDEWSTASNVTQTFMRCLQWTEWLRERTEYVPQLWNWENHS